MARLKPCAICGDKSGKVRVLYGRTVPPVLECGACGLRFVDCSPTRDEIVGMYDGYTDEYMQAVYEEHPDAYARDFGAKLDEIEALLGGKGRILDAGCGHGQFLAAARARGWNVAGVDISRSAAEHSSSLLGPVVQRATLETADFEPESFDAITMWDLIEHLSDPLPTLSAAARLLRNNGLLVIRTPSSDSLVSRVAHAVYALTGGRSRQLVQAQLNYFHLYRYSRDTLERITAKFGFAPLSVLAENSSFAIFASQHPGIGKGFAKSLLLRVFFCTSTLLHLQNKIVLTCRKEAGGAA